MSKKSYLGQKLDVKFQEAIEAGKQLADYFYDYVTSDAEVSAEKVEYFICYGKDEQLLNLCSLVSILPDEILENEVGLTVVDWTGSELIVKWSGK